MNFVTLMRQPAAIVPLVMSCGAFALVVYVLATVGVTHPPDEGAPARVFQLLLLLQAPVVAMFALKWLPRRPRPALVILLLQLGAAVAAVATISWLERGVVL
jgi:hypothetical protein